MSKKNENNLRKLKVILSFKIQDVKHLKQMVDILLVIPDQLDLWVTCSMKIVIQDKNIDSLK